MEEKWPPLTIITKEKLRPQVDIEIFLRVKGRLPTKEGDGLTVEICEEFIKRFMDHPQHGRYIGNAFERLIELSEEVEGKPNV